MLYDMAFEWMFRGLRRAVLLKVEKGRLYPWLDVCCGTGSQFRPLAGRRPEYGPVVGLDRSLGMVHYAAARSPGRSYVCGDASRLPFKPGAFRAVSVSFGLHDKSPAARRAMMDEAKRVLGEGGRLIAVDFESPWSLKSRFAALFTWIVERLAGGDHYRNGREFLRRGGLRPFLRENGFAEVTRRDVEAGCLGIVVSRPLP